MDLSIGEAGVQTGLSADTLRYYERIGLLGPVARNAGGQRRYGDVELARVRFVKRAQAMDFTLEEIGQLLTLRELGSDTRSDVRAMTETKLLAIEQRIENLSKLRDELAELVSECRKSTNGCPIIARMDSRHEPAGDRS